MGILQCATQKLTQPHDHTDRGFILMIAHQPSDGMEGVEHEVRLYLLAQCCQLRSRELPTEPHGLRHLMSHSLSSVHRKAETQDKPVHDHKGQHLGEKRRAPRVYE